MHLFIKNNYFFIKPVKLCCHNNKDIQQDFDLTLLPTKYKEKQLKSQLIERLIFRFSKVDFIYSPLLNIEYIVKLIITVIYLSVILLIFEVCQINFSTILSYIISLFNLRNRLENTTLNIIYEVSKDVQLHLVGIVICILYFLCIHRYFTRDLSKVVEKAYNKRLDNLFDTWESKVFYKYSLYDIEKERTLVLNFANPIGQKVFVHLLPYVLFFFVRYLTVKRRLDPHTFKSFLEQTGLIKLFMSVVLKLPLSKPKIQQNDLENAINTSCNIRAALVFILLLAIIAPIFILERFSQKTSHSYYKQQTKYVIENLDHIINTNLQRKYEEKISQVSKLYPALSKSKVWDSVVLFIGVMPLILLTYLLIVKKPLVFLFVRFLVRDIYSFLLFIQLYNVYTLIEFVTNHLDFSTFFEKCFFLFHGSGINGEPLNNLKGITYDKVHLTLNNKVILKDINLDLQHGLYLLFGESGSGKSTLLNSLYGVITPSSGSVIIKSSKTENTLPKSLYETMKNDYNKSKKIDKNSTENTDITDHEDLEAMVHYFSKNNDKNSDDLHGDIPKLTNQILKMNFTFNIDQKQQYKYDHRNLTEYTRSSIHKQVGYCTQELSVENKTILEFFQEVDKKVAIGEITLMLEKVHLYTWYLQQGQKEHSYLGDQGTRLSGGQLTRLVLAKNLLKLYNKTDKSFKGILLLDETLDKVDHKTRSEIVQTLYNILEDNKQLIIIIVSHLEKTLLKDLPHKKIIVQNKQVRIL